MPIYEYNCTSCGAELEKLQKISDPPLVECPECGKDTLVKRVSASSFRLKGSGWYETDFKTGKKKNGAGEAAPESAKDSVGSDNSAGGSKDSAAANKDSKPESKAETKTESSKEVKPSSDSAGAGKTSKPAAKD